MRALTTRQLLVACALGAALTLGAFPLSPSTAEACDRCNATFFEELLNERSGSLLAQDALNTMRNQRTQPFHRHTTAPLVPRVEALSDDVFAALAPSARAEVTAASALPDDALDQAPGPARAAPDLSQALAQADTRRAAAPSPGRATPGGADHPMFEGLDFLDIIARDEALTTRSTGTVSQDAEPDHVFNIVLHEGKAYLGNGVIYDGFLTNGGIPGPTLIMDEGDVVRMNITNEGAVPHGASIHAAYTQTSKYVGNVPPGETRSVTFRATHPGVYMYHCAPGGHAIPMHVLAGQYGMMVVRPTQQNYTLAEELGRGPDVEIFLLQHELYASGIDAIQGSPMYTAFNGRMFRYVEEPIIANPGDYVRINFLNVGPNLVSTFHLVGIVWDYVYWQGYPENRMTGGQTVTAGPSDSWVIEFRAPPDEGAYLMLNHAVGPTARGAIGILSVSADAERTPVVLADGPRYSTEEMEALVANARRTIAPFGIGSPDVDAPVRYGPEVDEVIIRIKGNSYDPKIVEVEPGTTIRFINEEVFSYMQGEFSGIHNAVVISGPSLFATPMLAHAEQATVTVTEPGQYDYMCTPHPYMRGRIIVRESAAAPEEPGRGGCSATGAGTPWAPTSFALLLGMGLLTLRRRMRTPTGA